MRARRFAAGGLWVIALAGAGCTMPPPEPPPKATASTPAPATPERTPAPAPMPNATSTPSTSFTASTPQSQIAARILVAARREVAKGTPYVDDGGALKFPGGDVPADTGVCTDLVVRALREAAGIDLQKEIRDDKVAHPALYPPFKARNPPDTDLDHRRCRNQVVWFRRRALELSGALDMSRIREDWQGGDIVFFTNRGDDHPWHVGIVSDKRDETGMPMIIDSFPPRTSETRYLEQYTDTRDHFRVTPALVEEIKAESKAASGTER